MTKLRILLNKRREHYKNRIKLRHGSTLYFLFAKKIGERHSWENQKSKCYEWRFRNHVYLTQWNCLQTYINKKYDY